MEPLFLPQGQILRRVGVFDFDQISNFVVREAQSLRPDFTAAAWTRFCDFLSPDQLFLRHADCAMGWLVQDAEGQIVAFCEVEPEDGGQRLVLLFVARPLRQRGLARLLVTTARSGVNKQTVLSSPSAEAFYDKMGFSPTGPRQTIDGINSRPFVWCEGDMNFLQKD